MEISDSTLKKYGQYALYLVLAFGGEEILRKESHLEDQQQHEQQLLKDHEERLRRLEWRKIPD